MTLKAMLDTHDEAALSALASVGLVRRAGRDLEAGKATVEARDETSATVIADGFTVSITESGPTEAKCTCPATGICRHILLATLALRADSDDTSDTGADDTTDEAAPTRTAAQDLTDLDEPAIRKFAGADWDKAIAQARLSTQATIAEDGPNLSVQLPDADKPVVFLAGLGLKGAVFKGAKSAKRRSVTAAALVARMQAGTQALDTLSQDEPEVDTLAPEFLIATRKAIAAAVRGVFGGGSVIAEEALFDLSISARAQAAPRLTALLRVLARQARQGRTHHFSYNDERFLSDAAFAYALTQALETQPSDPALTGVIRRHYAERDRVPLWLLGAVNWQADGGARGARFYAYAPDDGGWHTTGQARAAGMDPSFSPQAAYSNVLWGSAVANKLIGKHLTLADGRVSTDQQIAWDHGRANVSEAAPHPLEAAADAGILHSTWGDALDDLSQRMTKGLRRSGISVPLLIEPTDFGTPSFDDIAQIYRLPALDAHRMSLDLSIPASRAGDIEWLEKNKSTVAAVLCEVTVSNLDLMIIPVTLYQNTRRTGLTIINLTFDRFRKDTGAGTLGERALSFLKTGLRPSGGAAIDPDPIRAFCEETLGVTANTLRFGGSEAQLKDLRKRADTLGLLSLSTALATYEVDGSPDNALRISYLAAELLRDCPMTP